MLRATTACTFSTSERQRVVRSLVFCTFYILTWKGPSRHNGAHFFNISTSKSGLRMVCLLGNVLRATTACTFSTSERQRVVRSLVFCTFYILTWKGPSRHNGVHIFNISTSKSGLRMVCLLGNVLRATTACIFSTSERQKVVRKWCALYILSWKCASRHNGMHIFNISTSKSGPKMVCFVHFDLEMCFAPQRHATFYFSSSQMAPHPPL